MTRTVSVDSICIMAHLLFSFSCSVVYFLKGMRRARPTRAHLERLSCAPQTAALRRPRHDANPLGKKFLGTGTRGNPRQASTSVSDATRGKNKKYFHPPCGAEHESARKPAKPDTKPFRDFRGSIQARQFETTTEHTDVTEGRSGARVVFSRKGRREPKELQ